MYPKPIGSRKMQLETETSDFKNPTQTTTGFSDEDLAGLAKALAHPARIKIIRFLLAKKSCIGGDIVDEVGLAQSTVSEHLRILKSAGIIIGEIERPRVCYSVNADRLVPFANFLNAVFETTSQNGTTAELCWVSTKPKN